MRLPPWMKARRTGTRWEFTGKVPTDGTTGRLASRPVAVVYDITVDIEALRTAIDHQPEQHGDADV